VPLVVHWAVLAAAFWITAKVVPGFRLYGAWNAIVVAAIFGVVNFFLHGLLYSALVVLTLGIGWLLSFLTQWVVNAILLKLTDAMTSRLELRNFGTALIGALVLSFLSQAGLYLADVAMHRPHPGTVIL
jgi:putative membrane protein